MRWNAGGLARLLPMSEPVAMFADPSLSTVGYGIGGGAAVGCRSAAFSGDDVFKLPESVLVVVHTADLDVLLLERDDTDEVRWQSVTGSRESGDADMRGTALREVLEETGLDIAAGLSQGWTLRDWRLRNRYELWPAWRVRYAPGVTHNVEHVFGLTLPSRLPIRLAPGEHRAYVWLPYEEAQHRCFSPTNRDAIAMLGRFVPQPERKS